MEIKCPICGSYFTLTAPHQKYCSKTCSYVGRLISTNIWLDAHPHYYRDKKRAERSRRYPIAK